MNGTITDFLVVADQIFILVLLIAAGYVAVSTEIMDPRATRGLSGLLVNITLPALIIASMQVPITPARLAGAETLLLATVVFFILSFAVARVTSRAMPMTSSERGVFEFAIVFGNVGFMGFPVAQTLFGAESLFYVAIFNLVFNFLVFSVGIAMLTGEQEGDLTRDCLQTRGSWPPPQGFSSSSGRWRSRPRSSMRSTSSAG